MLLSLMGKDQGILSTKKINLDKKETAIEKQNLIAVTHVCFKLWVRMLICWGMILIRETIVIYKLDKNDILLF